MFNEKLHWFNDNVSYFMRLSQSEGEGPFSLSSYDDCISFLNVNIRFIVFLRYEYQFMNIHINTK